MNWIIDCGHVVRDGESPDEDPPTDCGVLGDSFRINLRVAGRWRVVDWEKISSDDRDLRACVGKYYITGSWNDWSWEEMTEADGRYFVEVTLLRDGGEFQIARNRDWNQVFYPSFARASFEWPSEVLGPDGRGHGHNWILDGEAGDVFA